MRLKAQILLIVFLVIVLAVIIAMVRKRRLELKYVLVWMICDIALLILTLFPRLLGWIADLLGIYSPMNMVFFLGILFSLIIIFTLTVTLSRVTAKVRRIAQVLAMLPEEIQEEVRRELQRNSAETGAEAAGANPKPAGKGPEIGKPARSRKR